MKCRECDGELDPIPVGEFAKEEGSFMAHLEKECFENLEQQRGELREQVRCLEAEIERLKKQIVVE